MKLNRRYSFTALGVLLVAVSAVAYADHDGGDREPASDAVPVTQSAVSMVQAIQAAELRGSGKARRAEYENSKHGWVYEVEIVSANRVVDVRVSAVDGSVLSAKEDAEDREEREDNHRGKH